MNLGVAVSLNVAQPVLERPYMCKSPEISSGDVSLTCIRSIVVDFEPPSRARMSQWHACIYCNYKEQTILASLLKQLVQDHATTSDEIKMVYMNHRKKLVRNLLNL